MPHSHGHDAQEITQRKKKDRRGKKGITMEDLKQQTAARLAKEQRRRNAATGRVGAFDNVNTNPAHITIVPSTSVEMSVSCDNSIGSSSHQHNSTLADDFPHGRFGSKATKAHHSDTYHSPRMQGHAHRQQQRHNHQSPQNYTPQKNHLHRSTQSVGSGTSSKLPHGLTVQELKEMTRARLAAEAAEARETVKSSDSVEADSISHAPTYDNHSRTRLYSHESRDSSFGRHPIVSTDSFGSNVPERQRLGSVESFSSTLSVHNASGYNGMGLLTPSLSHDQQPVSSFSYDAMDNESYASAMGTEAIFGDTQISKTNKHTANSLYRMPYSSEKSAPALNNNHVAPKCGRTLWSDPFARACSPVPTIGNSTTSFGHSEQENESLFATPTALGKMERLTSAGAAVPNSVAESVLLGTSDDNFGQHNSEMYRDSRRSPSAFVSPEVKRPTNDNLISYTSPWSNPAERYNDNGEVDEGIAKLQSEWNTFLNFESNSASDDFPLSTFTSKASDQSRLNQLENYSSPFQTVPEERVIQNLASRDVNVPESFIDEPNEESTISKIGIMMRRKKSRN